MLHDDDIEDHAPDCNKRSGGLCDCGFELGLLRDQGHDVPDDGHEKPLGYVTPDGHLEVRESVDKAGRPFRGYHETELGQHDRWLRQAPDLYALYVEQLKPGFPWYLQAQLGSGKRFSSDRRLSVWQRLRILFGAPVTVVFRSPDGKCHAACSIHFGACRDWFDDDDAKAGRLP